MNILDDGEKRAAEDDQEQGPQIPNQLAKGREEKLLWQLDQCRWFKRGWTLQELIAPEKVLFYDREWNLIDDKSMLEGVLERLTGIDRVVLRDRRAVASTSVAKRMSWAASRSTTREEDEAYCLLGIFGVNMPLLYGEGVKAFQRLQEEIVRTSTSIDHSILVWSPWEPVQYQEQPNNRNVAAQLFSPSPYGFRHCKHIESWSLPNLDTFELLPRGLRLTLPVTPLQGELSGTGLYSALLNCCSASRRSDVKATQLTIDLQERQPMPTLLTDGSVIENTSAEFLCDSLFVTKVRSKQTPSPETASAWKTTTFTLAREIFRYQVNSERIHVTGSCASSLELCETNQVQPGSNVVVRLATPIPFRNRGVWDRTSGILNLAHYLSTQPEGSLEIGKFEIAEPNLNKSVSLIFDFRMEARGDAKPPKPTIHISIRRLEVHGPAIFGSNRRRSAQRWFTSIETSKGCVFYLRDVPVLLVRNQLVNIAGDIIWSFSIDRCDEAKRPSWMDEYINAPMEKSVILE